MRKILVLALLVAFLPSCGGSEDNKNEVTIPVPIDKSTIEPTVARLLYKTGNDVQLNINDPNKWMVYGSALFANAYYNEAAIALRHAITIKPEMPQATYLLATVLWKANRKEEAVEELQTALALIPEYDMGWRLLAQWQLERGDTAEAEVSARRAFELNSGRIGTRYILALCLMDDGRYDEALPLLEEAIDMNAPPWIYTLAGNCYRQLGMSEQAKQALEQSGPPFVDWPDPMFKHIPNLIAGKAELAEYAMHIYKNRGPQKAKPFLIRAFQINPEHVNVRVALSIALQSEGQLEQAKRLLKELQGEPNTNYWKQYAGICIGRNELKEAQEHISKAIFMDMSDANAHDIAAVIATQQGDNEEACRQREQAGMLYVEEKQWEKAELSLAYAYELGVMNIQSMQAFALAQIELEHYPQARTTIRSLLDIDPNNPRALEYQRRIPTE